MTVTDWSLWEAEMRGTVCWWAATPPRPSPLARCALAAAGAVARATVRGRLKHASM